jgi:hypothetical protein
MLRFEPDSAAYRGPVDDIRSWSMDEPARPAMHPTIWFCDPE